MDEDTFSRTIGSIYAAAVSPEHWPIALEQLRVIFRGNAVATMLRNTVTAEGQGIAVGETPISYQEYLAQWTGRNIISNRTRVWRSGAVETDQDVLPKSELLCSEYYNDFMKRSDINAVLRLSLHYENGIWSGLSVTRSCRAEEFGSSDITLGRIFVPHLQRALVIAQHIRHAKITSDAMLERLQHPLLILGSGGRLIHFNQAAETLLAQADGLIAAASTLHAASPALTSRLHALLANAAEEGRRRPVACAMRLPRPSGKPDLALMAMPLQLEFEWLLPRQPSVLLCITDPEATPAIPAGRLTELFGLTRAEASIAVELMAGRDVSTIAERQGCSVNTVRVHLARLLAKTNTNRQSELMRLLMNLPALRTEN
jgi:DNA-binding CsgD family transcriptional regulator